MIKGYYKILLENICFHLTNHIFNISSSENIRNPFSHAHNVFELHCIVGGNGNYVINDKIINIKENDTILITPTTYHHIPSSSSAFDSVRFTLLIDREYTDCSVNYYEKFMSTIKNSDGFILIPDNPKIAGYIKSLSEIKQPKTLCSYEKNKAFLTLIFCEILGFLFGDSDCLPNAQNIDSDDFRRLYYINGFFTRRYKENVTLTDLAKQLYLSERQTAKLVKELFHVNFHEKLIDMRIKNAKKLLFETDMSIESISEAVGFISYNGFYLAFKKRYGMSPQQFRDTLSDPR